MVVRNLKKSYKNVTGRFYSGRLCRLVQFDSILERDFIQILDVHPSVLSFSEQPMKIRFFDEEGVDQCYVPDFHITFKGGFFLGQRVERPWLVETKYRRDLEENWAKIAPKVRAGIRTAHGQKSTFHIVTELSVNGPALANAKFLRRFANAEPPPELTSMVLAQARRPGGITIGEIRSASPIHSYGHLIDQALWSALARRRMIADLEEPLSPDTRLRME